MSTRIDPNLLADIATPNRLCISSDGTKVVYQYRPLLIRQNDNIQSSLWIAHVGKEHSAKQLTTGDYNDSSPKISPDGNYVSFISDRAKPGKAQALYLLPLDGGEAFPLTTKSNEMGIGTYHWSPNSRSIAFTAADEKSEERKQREEDKNDATVYDEDIDYVKLHVVDIVSKECKTLKSATGSGKDLAWSSDSTNVVYASLRSPILDDLVLWTRVQIINVDQDSAREICVFPSELNGLAWYEDKIYWSGDIIPGRRTAGKGIYAASASDQDAEFKLISHGQVDDVKVLQKCGNDVVVQVTHGLTDILETANGTLLYQEERQIEEFDVAFYDSQTTIVLAQGSTGIPIEIFSVVNGSKVQLSQHGRAIADKNIGKAHLYEYTHEDGTPIDGLYMVPTELEADFLGGKPLPTVLYVHGGPLSRITDCFDTTWHWNTFFMSLGYLVLCPNYRGGTSHGHDYAEFVRHDAAASYADVIWQVKKGIEEKHIDPDRVAITGWSQGGFLSYLAVTRDESFHFSAAIAGAGVSDWTTMPLTSDLPTYEATISGPAPWDMKSIDDLQSRKCSPIYHMQNINTPMLILHGEKDERVPVEQAIGFYRGMKAKGKDVTMITYPREGHCVPIPWEKKHYLDMMGRVEKFLRKCME